MKRMRRAKTREEQWEVGLDLSREILTLVHERVQGLQISAPFNRAEPAKRLLSYLRDELKR